VARPGEIGNSSGPMPTSHHCRKMPARLAACPSSCKTQPNGRKSRSYWKRPERSVRTFKKSSFSTSPTNSASVGSDLPFHHQWYWTDCLAIWPPTTRASDVRAKQINQLKSMVGDLLEITRGRPHKLTVESRPLSPAKSKLPRFRTRRANAAGKKYKPASEVAPGLPSLWPTPPGCGKFWTNLIDNGIKLRPKWKRYGGSAGPSRKTTIFCVYRLGYGMRNQPGKLWTSSRPFWPQVKSTIRSSRSGTGAGAVHFKGAGHPAWWSNLVGSQPGQGSTFFLPCPVVLAGQTVCRHLHYAKTEAASRP